MNTDTENTAAAAAPETVEAENARLQRDNAWLKAQLVAAEKTLAMTHLPLPPDDYDDEEEDPPYWTYARLAARYCAVLRRNDEIVDGHTELLARLFRKETVAGAHFTVSEGAAADAVMMAEKRIYALKARLGKAEADVEAYKRAWAKEQDRVEVLEGLLAGATAATATATATATAEGEGGAEEK